VTALGIDAGISKSEVSRICAGLDEHVDAFRSRSLDHVGFPYVLLDATYLHVRSGHHVTSKAVVIATGVTMTGHREVLGLDVGDSEDETFWTAFLRSLRARGLDGVRLVISDQHAGLVAALRRVLQGAAHQRCRVHFTRNLLAAVPKGNQEMVAAAFRTIFAQASPAEMATQWDHVEQMLAERFAKAAHLMDEAKEEVLAFSAFPRAHWRQLWSTNPLERLNKELKRRCRVVGIFPDEASVIRLAGAVLADVHDEWQAAERRYFSEASMAKLAPRDNDVADVGELVPAD
jgi:transposase-like protein